jgi:hypothetical protein
VEESAFLDSLDRALIGAGAAADANVGIDYVLVFALGDSLDGALVGAGAALDTSVSNVVSHDIPSKLLFKHPGKPACKSILTLISENAIPFFENIRIFFGCTGETLRIREESPWVTHRMLQICCSALPIMPGLWDIAMWAAPIFCWR